MSLKSACRLRRTLIAGGVTGDGSEAGYDQTSGLPSRNAERMWQGNAEDACFLHIGFTHALMALSAPKERNESHASLPQSFLILDHSFHFPSLSSLVWYFKLSKEESEHLKGELQK